MTRSTYLVAILVSLLTARAAFPQAAKPPILRLEGNGPTGAVTALAFGPDGKTLYAAGYDKVVRAWALDPATKRFEPKPERYRVPIGPGAAGVINVLAVSPDGEWLAVSGLGVARGEAGFDEDGVLYRITTRQTDTDRGVIYLFPLKDRKAPIRLLRGHTGVVEALAFAPPQKGQPAVLVSVAREPGDEAGSEHGHARAWDVGKALFLDEKGREVNKDAEVALADWRLPKVETGLVPGLAVRRTGTGPKELRVVVAWADGWLRTWDVATGRKQKAAAADFNNSVEFASDSQLVTGGYDKDGGDGGHLQFWDDRPDEVSVAKGRLSLQEDGYADLPCGLRLLGGAGGKADRAAVLLRVKDIRGAQEGRQRYWFSLASLSGRSAPRYNFLWELGRDVPVGDPVMAASPDGRHVAVSGPGMDVIRIYRVNEFLKNEKGAHYPLPGGGRLLRGVAFAERQRAPGLLLRAETIPGSDGTVNFAGADLVFDFAGRRLVREPGKEGWEVSSRTPVSYQYEEGGTAALFSWQGGGLRVPLDKREEVTAWALIPPPRGGKTGPLVAVATWNAKGGVPRLRLYRADTGEPVRSLKAHSQRVRSLTASADGRLLASAADDRTVCLWSLIDVAGTIDRHGALTGVELRQRDKELVVERLDPDSPARRKLEEGNVITRLDFTEAAKKDDPKSLVGPDALKFCAALWDVKRGTTVWVSVKGGDDPLALTLGQGIDVRKPLLSLFVAGEGTAATWIAWTPFGPYDAGSEKVQDYVGWHYNPTKAGEAPQFEELGAKREKYSAPKLLEPLLKHADFHKAWAELKAHSAIPRPRFRIDAVGDAVERGPDGHYLVRDPKVEVRVTIEEPSSLDDVEWVSVKGPGAEEQRFDLGRATGKALSQNVVLPKRGVYDLVLAVKTRNPDQVAEPYPLKVRYQPPAPTIDVTEPKSDVLPAEGKFTFRGRVSRPAGVERVKVFIRWGGADEVELDVDKDGRVEKELMAKAGANVLELRAVNGDALARYESEETAERVVRLEAPRRAPRVAFTRVELDPGTRDAREVAVTPGKVLVVNSPKVRLVGTVTTAAATVGKSLEVKIARKGEEKAVSPEPEGEGKEFTVTHTLELPRGGEQEFVLKARADGKGLTGESPPLRIEYLPALPGLQLAPPAPAPLTLTEDKDSKGPPRVEVKGTFTPAGHAEAFKARVRVFHDKEEKPFEKEIAFEKPTGKPVSLGEFPLRRGDNRIEVRVSSEWRKKEEVAAEWHVFLRRPPIVTRLDLPESVTEPATGVKAVVRFPEDAPLTKVIVNGQVLRLADVVKNPKTAGGVTTAEIEVKVVALPNKGAKNRVVVLEAHNEDGAGKEEGEVEVKAVPPPKPTVSVRKQGAEGDQSLIFTERRVRLHLEVRSEKVRLRRVEVKQDGKTVKSLDVAGQKEEPQGGFLLAADVELDLPEGTTPLAIEAENEGSLEERRISATVQLPPLVAVEFDPPPAKSEFGKLKLTGRVRLRPGDDDKLLDELLKRMRVYVNDFRQPRLQAEGKARGRLQEFSVTVLLNQKNNKIVFECPGIPKDALPREPFAVSCDEPARSRLHLIVVNASGEPQGVGLLKQRALAALLIDPRTFESKVFSEVVPYPVLKKAPRDLLPLDTGVNKDLVKSVLNQVEAAIRKDDSANDVVLIYWLGKEQTEKGQRYLLTSEGQAGASLADKAFTIKELLAADRDVRGARVLLLDVTAAESKSDPALAWEGTHAAVLRCAWSAKKETAPELLRVLAEAAKGRGDVRAESRLTLKGAEDATQKAREGWGGTLTEFTPYLSGLSDLVLALRPAGK